MSTDSAPVAAPDNPGDAPAVELVGIDKRFGAVHANRGVSLTIAKGSIHGIVDENNAALITDAMKAAVEGARTGIIAGRVAVIDYRRHGRCTP